MVFGSYCERRYSGQLNWHAREESLSLVLITAPLYIYPLIYIYFIYILHLFTEHYDRDFKGNTKDDDDDDDFDAIDHPR